MKILFLTPPYHAGVVEVAGRWLPLYLVTLAGACRAAGHQCVIYDAMTKQSDFSAIERVIRRERPQIVALSMFTATAPDVIETCRLTKKIDAGIRTVVGGIHATFMFVPLLQENSCLDYVVVGEGDRTLPALLDCLQKNGDCGDISGLAFRQGAGVVFTGHRPFLADLDNLPMAWNLLDWQDYTYFILPGSRLGAVATSRGCEHRCSFCSQQKLWRRTWRGRSAIDVVREIEELHGDHGVDVVLFTDDYPTPDRQRWEEILDQLIERDLGVSILMETRAEDIVRDADILDKYRQAGIIHIYIGIEATNQDALDLMRKDLDADIGRKALALCRRAGIITETSMILGFPDETPEKIERTIDLAIDYDPDFAHFLAITPWPYADIYPQLAPFVESEDYRLYNLVEPIIRPKVMSRAQVDAAIVEGYRRFYRNKFTKLAGEPESFRSRYIRTAFERIMNDSFIRKKLGMPSWHSMAPQKGEDTAGEEQNAEQQVFDDKDGTAQAGAG